MLCIKIVGCIPPLPVSSRLFPTAFFGKKENHLQSSHRKHPLQISTMSSKIFCVTLGFVLLAMATPAVFAGIAELLNDVESPILSPDQPPIMSNSLQDIYEENGIGSPCHVEYQVTKRIMGRCIKLGHGARGCVSGSYLNPFHPDCM